MKTFDLKNKIIVRAFCKKVNELHEILVNMVFLQDERRDCGK